MLRQGLGVPEVDAGQEVTLLVHGELLEHFLDVDVCHLMGVTLGTLDCMGCNYKSFY